MTAEKTAEHYQRRRKEDKEKESLHGGFEIRYFIQRKHHDAEWTHFSNEPDAKTANEAIKTLREMNGDYEYRLMRKTTEIRFEQI
jgi:hypothetical protein